MKAESVSYWHNAGTHTCVSETLALSKFYNEIYLSSEKFEDRSKSPKEFLPSALFINNICLQI